MKTSIEEYKDLTIAYGILTILLVKDHFEEEEEYIECHKIVKALELMDSDFGMNTPKHSIKFSLEEAQRFYQKSGQNPSIEELKRKFSYYKNIVLKIVTA